MAKRKKEPNDPAASEQELRSLHGEMATMFTDMVRNGVKKVTEKGGVVTVHPNAGMLGVIRAFLKDNGIVATKANQNLSDLMKAIEDMDNMPFDGTVPEEYQNKH